jgi:glutamate racemase
VKNAPVGFFDSGVGGRSVLAEFSRLCPREKTVYLADTDNCPYGNRSEDEVRALSAACAEKLIAAGCKMVVVACNTASAAALEHLRALFPATPFVGMEPAVKPAAERTKSGIIAVLATRGTFNGRLYRETLARHCAGVRVIESVADEFVRLVESGDTSSAKAEEAVRSRIEPLVAAGADQIVLGCTHFPHLKKLIEKTAAERAAVVDPSEAVALRAKSVLVSRRLLA